MMALALTAICGYGQTSGNNVTDDQLRQFAEKSKELIAGLESGEIAPDTMEAVLQRNIMEVFKPTAEDIAKAQKEAENMKEITDKDGNVVSLEVDFDSSLEEKEEQLDGILDAMSDRMTPRFAKLMKESTTSFDIPLTVDEIVDDSEMTNDEKCAIINMKIVAEGIKANEKQTEKEMEELEQKLYDDGFFTE